MMKIYALFLPQFHEIKENNEWWGDGFTEWVNVKNAQPLFNGHIQPKLPLNDNYYNLLDKSTVQNQTKLMKDYGVDGLVYYHYYFNGKMLLEKPAENLLKWTDIDQSFFFNWANHSWKRTWNGTSEILLEQTYGTRDDWRKHFEYLLPFFKDKRYVKVDNAPVFMVFNPNFKEKKDIFNCFDMWCKEEGFSGLHLIEEAIRVNPDTYEPLIDEKADCTKGIWLGQPMIARDLLKKKSGRLSLFNRRAKNKLIQSGIIKKVDTYSGDDLIDIMLRYEPVRKDLVPGLFFEWDNTPRHKYRGYIINRISQKKFLEYMDKIKDCPILIVNAFNEWAEGMMLEPTNELGYKYLEWIKQFKDSV